MKKATCNYLFLFLLITLTAIPYACQNDTNETGVLVDKFNEVYSIKITNRDRSQGEGWSKGKGKIDLE